jgi:tetratricopeptide (TPR) repeat protein
MKNTFYLFILLCLCLARTLFAQQNSEDSLWVALEKEDLADSVKMSKQIEIANLYFQKGNYNRAIEICENVIAQAQKNNYKRVEADAAHRLGTLLTDKGKFHQALDLLLKAVKLRKDLDDKLNVARSLNNIGAIYIELKNYPKALEFMREALQILKKAENLGGVALISGNIGNVYNNMHQYDSALWYVQASLQIRKKMQDKQGEAYSLNYLGGIYEKQNKPNLAIQYYLEALKIEEEFKDHYLMCFSYQNIGYLYLTIKNTSLARDYFQKAETIARQIGASKELSKVYQLYAQVDSAENNFQSAYQWQTLHQQLKDSVFNVEKSKQIAELQTSFEVAQKESQIKDLSQKAQIQELEIEKRNWLLGGSLVLLLILGFAVYEFAHNRRIEARYQLLQSELRWRRSQMNPHFFFNAMGAIQDVVSRSETSTAIAYIAKFAKLMRQTLEQSQEEFVALSTEIEMLRYYLDLQKLRFPKKFTYLLDHDEDLETDEILIPVMLLQPIIENAIEHGFKEKQERGELLIRFQKYDNHLVISIKDNGVGMPTREGTTEIQHGKHRSMSGQILQDRIRLLAKQSNFPVGIEFDSKPYVGTEVNLRMPLKYA